MNRGEGYTYFHYYICNLLAKLRVSINIPSENADTSNEKEGLGDIIVHKLKQMTLPRANSPRGRDLSPEAYGKLTGL